MRLLDCFTLLREEKNRVSRLSKRVHHKSRSSSTGAKDKSGTTTRSRKRVSRIESVSLRRRKRGRSGDAAGKGRTVKHGNSHRRMNGNANVGMESDSGDSCSTCDEERGKGREGRLREDTLAEMHKVAHDMRVKWADWDRGVGGFEVTFEIRELREHFGALVEQWYELRGREDVVKELISWVSEMDVRITLLDEMVEVEVGRWEMDARELWEKWKDEGGGGRKRRHGTMRYGKNAGGNGRWGELGGLAGVATCAADMIIELDIYRTTHEKVLSEEQKSRLGFVAKRLKSIDEMYKELEKQKRDDPDYEDLYSAYSTFSRRGALDYYQVPEVEDSREIDSYEQFTQKSEETRHRTYADPPMSSPYDSQNSGGMSQRSTPSSSADEREDPMQKYNALASKSSTTKKGRAMRSTLHERPSQTLGRRRPKFDDPENPFDQLPSSPRTPPPGDGEQNGHLVAPESFSSSLYQTVHHRKSAVQDLGSLLQPSRVKGDGRCMFRAVARSRAAAKGSLSSWSEPMERRVADMLRKKVCDALLDHRRLLTTYYVIEGDFDEYVQRMRSAKRFGGEPELLMLARILHVPISVYIGTGRSYRQIQVYGRVYQGDPVQILLDGVHYDCLLTKQQQRDGAYTHRSQYRENAKDMTSVARKKPSRAPSDLSKKSLGSNKGRKVSSDRKSKRE